MHSTLPTLPTLPLAQPPFGAVVDRQLSVWPFAARTQRLFLLIDPSLADPELRGGVLRAMQQAYFRSDSCSQTRAVRDAAMAAHYVLHHLNHDALPENQLNVAGVVAAIRGNLAYVALAGDAVVLAWRHGTLTGERGLARVARPLGLEHEPRVTLWSTPVEQGDRLVLVCGAEEWPANSAQQISEILSSSSAAGEAEGRLSSLLSGSGESHAGILVVDGVRPPRPDRRLVLVSSTEHGREHVRTPAPRRPAPSRAAAPLPVKTRRWGWLSPIGCVALAAAAILLALTPRIGTPRSTDAAAPPEDVSHVIPVTPAMAVWLGPSGSDVIDLAVGPDELYTLDVVESSVRAFGLDARDQTPTPDSLLARAGASFASSSRRLGTPVAIHYLPGAVSDAQSGLTILDDARQVVQVSRDRKLNARPLPSSAGWLELGALGVDAGGHAYLLDVRSRQLLEYGLQNQRMVDPPRLVFDATTAPWLPFDRAAQIVGLGDRLAMRMDDGTLRSFDASGAEVGFEIRPPDGRPASVVSVAADRAGGLYLADVANARVLHTTADGSVLRQLRDPALAGLRQIESSFDGRRLYGLVASGVLVFDVPSESP